MSFNNSYFTSMTYGGGQGNTIWHYYDAADDNLSSLVMGTINAGFFSRAFSDHGIKGRVGDMIFVSSYVSVNSGVNSATPNVQTFIVQDDWDSNGASVMRVGGVQVA